jgi:8-oxo-dGTP pyrophosphatase MutT (NUDIX family)
MPIARPTNRASVSVILTTTDGRVLLQLRDDIPGIEYPGHLSLIGGWIEPGETRSNAIRRELHEELEGTDGAPAPLGQITFLGPNQRTDRPWTEYVFHASLLTPPEFVRIREGRGLRVCSFGECSTIELLAPHHRAFIEKYRHRIEADLIL